MAAGLRPDPLGELERSPRPPSRNEGAYLGKGEGRGGREGEGEEARGGREGKGEEGKGEGRGGKGKKGEGIRPPQADRLDPPLDTEATVEIH